jgi:hypothetical protein
VVVNTDDNCYMRKVDLREMEEIFRRTSFPREEEGRRKRAIAWKGVVRKFLSVEFDEELAAANVWSNDMYPLAETKAYLFKSESNFSIFSFRIPMTKCFLWQWNSVCEVI